MALAADLVVVQQLVPALLPAQEGNHISWNWGQSGVTGAQGASTGYSVGGPWGALAGGVIGGLVGGTQGSQAGMPMESPLVGMSDAEYGWYQQNIAPQQQQLLNYATDPNVVNRNVQQAQTDVSQQFANNPQAFNAQIQGRGGTVNPAQSADFAKENSLNEGIASTSAANTTRAATYAQQQGVLMKGG